MLFFGVMPITQIICLMIALVLIVGAPTGKTPALSLETVVLFWAIKALGWGLLVFWLTGRVRTVQGLSSLFERLHWASLIPLMADFYLLDLKTHLILVPGAGAFPTLLELLGLAFFVVYLLISWGALWWTLHRRGLTDSSLSADVGLRLRMLLPALIPYVFIAASGDLLHLVPSPTLQSVLNTLQAQIFFFVAFVGLLLFLVPPMIRVIWGCLPVPQGALREAMEGFLEQTGIRCRDILIWPLAGGRSCTAAVLGLIPRFRYLLITPCLIQNLTPGEIEAVLAHEVAHLRHRHLLWYVFFLGIYSVLIYRLFDPLWTWLLSHRYFLEFLITLQDSPHGLTSFLAIVPLGILLVLYFRFLMGYFMRHFERQADLAVFDAQGHPWNLINALEKVGLLAGGIRNQPSWHHFSIAERVSFLAKAEEQPRLRQRFERSLRQKKAMILGTAAAMVILPSFLPVHAWQSLARGHLTKFYIEQVMNRGQQRPEWYLMLGHLLAKNKEDEEALKAYGHALELAPEDAEVLNSMAWFLATTKDPRLRRPREALTYAREAVRRDPAPHIMDTLAETLFVNGYREKAIAVEKEALARDPANARYYKSQIERFEQGLIWPPAPDPPSARPRDSDARGPVSAAP